MHNVEIPRLKINRNYASEIPELTPRQFSAFMELVLQFQSGQISATDFKTFLICKLLNIKKSTRWYNLQKEKQDTINENIFRLTETLDSFFDTEKREGKEVKVLNLNFIKNMLPRIGRYYGPDDALTNCNFYEYKEAHYACLDYLKTENEDSLNCLVAILYRPRKMFYHIRRFFPGYDGQKRRHYGPKTNPFFLKNRILRISRLPFAIRYGTLLWFHSCEEYLMDGKPVIDGSEIDLSILYTKGDEGSKGDIGLTGLIFSLAESGVFGNIEATADANLYDVMARLVQLKKAKDELEAKQKENDQS